MMSVLALTLALACRAVHTPPAGTAVSAFKAPGSAASGATERLTVEGLRDVACLAEGCLVWQTTSGAGAHLAVQGEGAIHGAEPGAHSLA